PRPAPPGDRPPPPRRPSPSRPPGAPPPPPPPRPSRPRPQPAGAVVETAASLSASGASFRWLLAGRPGSGRFPGMGKACVIGAGSSGIAAGQVLQARGIDFDCFEKGSQVGGNWRYENDNGMSSAYRS